MNEAELLDKVKIMLIDLGNLRISPADLAPDMELNSLGIDSLDLVTIYLEFEQEFDVLFENEEIVIGNNTVEDLTKKITSKLSGV